MVQSQIVSYIGYCVITYAVEKVFVHPNEWCWEWINLDGVGILHSNIVHSLEKKYIWNYKIWFTWITISISKLHSSHYFKERRFQNFKVQCDIWSGQSKRGTPVWRRWVADQSITAVCIPVLAILYNVYSLLEHSIPIIHCSMRFYT